MRRRPVPFAAALSATGLAAILLAGCGGGSATPPAATDAASPSAAAPATEQPASASGSPGAPVTAAPPTPVGGQEQPEVVVVAQGITWEPTALSVPAGVAFRLGIDNRDAGIPHNLELRGLDGAAIASSQIVTGPGQVAVEVPALEPGAYPFVCVIHPNMVGVLTAE